MKIHDMDTSKYQMLFVKGITILNRCSNKICDAMKNLPMFLQFDSTALQCKSCI